MEPHERTETWSIQMDGMTVAEFEHFVRSTGVHVRATQFDGDTVRIHLRAQKVGDIILLAASATQPIALEWQERRDSLNISLCTHEGALLMDGRPRALPSMVIYSDPSSGVWAGQWRPSSRENSLYHITLPTELALGLGYSPPAPRRGWFEVSLEIELADRIKALLEEQLSRGEDGLETRVGTTIHVVETLLSQVRHHSVEVVMPSPYPRIIRALGDSCETTRGPVSVARLAAEIHVSTRTVQRAFHSTLGVGAKRYLRVRQLRRAHELLRSGECSVSGAAHSVGFPHTSRFSQEYFAHFGVYPSETIAAAEGDPSK